MDIYKKLSKSVVNFLNENEAVDNSKSEIYEYGLELLFASIVNIICVIIIGALNDRLPETVLFLTMFCPLRQLAGGYHAPNHFICGVTFNVTYLVLVIIEKNWWFINKWWATLIIMFCTIIIFMLAPVEDRNKTLSKRQKRVFKKRVRVLTILYVLLIVILMFVFKRMHGYITYIIYTLLVSAVLVILGYIKNRKDRLYEKDNG